jgi:perosamine synthetase
MEGRSASARKAVVMGTLTHRTPSLPTFDWNTFSGNRKSTTPCMLEQADVHLTTSGRASIVLALEALGIGPGDTVLVPSYHCPTMIAPIVQRGAQPVFYPLDAIGAPLIDWIRQLNPTSARAILVAHFFGLPQPLSPIRAWCDQNSVRLIEDCAHALFGNSGGRPIGTWGDLAIGSLTKFLPIPEGGCLVSRLDRSSRPALSSISTLHQIKAAFDVVHTSANHRRLKGFGEVVRGLHALQRALKRGKPIAEEADASAEAGGTTIDMRVAHQELALACRWIALHAPRERIVEQRRNNYAFFAQAFADQGGMRALVPSLPDDCAPYVFPLWVDRPDPGYAELRRRAFPVSRWDRLWPAVPEIAGDMGVKWSSHILQLACHQDLRESELEQMVVTLKNVYGSTPA